MTKTEMDIRSVLGPAGGSIRPLAAASDLFARRMFEERMDSEDIFLTKVRKQSLPVTVFLMNGFQLRGSVTGFDSFTVVLDTDGKQQIIYKHAISTIVPIHPVSLQEEPCLSSDE